MEMAPRLSTWGRVGISLSPIENGKDMLVEANKKSMVWLWASVAAAATGIAAVAVILRLHEKRVDNTSSEVDHRDLQRVLSDCYQKIQEIEERLPSVSTTSGSGASSASNTERSRRKGAFKQVTNGSPLYDA